jgi:hypothetical protein
MLARAARFSFLLTLLASVACGGGGDNGLTGPVNDLLAAQMRWAQTETDNYSIKLTRSCDCPAEEEGSVMINVQDGQTYTRVYVSQGYNVPTYLLPLFPDVWELFDLVTAARLEGPAPISEAYHATYGYPTRIVMPGGVTYEMSNLVLR